MTRTLFAVLALAALLATFSILAVWGPFTGSPPKVVLVLFDDVGFDLLESVETPNLDRIQNEGLWLSNVYTNPLCSPSRATIESGRYGFRTGIGKHIRPLEATGELNPEDGYLGHSVAAAGRRAAFVGKWHLGLRSHVEHATRFGYEHTAGSLSNLYPGDYFEWDKTINGVTKSTTVYATTDTTNDAIDFYPSMDLLVVSYNAAHWPPHQPPQHLHSLGRIQTEWDYSRAMLQALDTEFGRFLEIIDLESTTVLVFSDNGTSKTVGGGKGRLDHSGIHVPSWAIGRGVRPGTCDHLINTTDIPATVLDLLGLEHTPPEDARSFAAALAGDPTPAREWVYSERFSPNGDGPWDNHRWMMFDGRFRLIALGGKLREFYDLANDPEEKTNLLRGELSEEHEQIIKILQDNRPH